MTRAALLAKKSNMPYVRNLSAILGLGLFQLILVGTASAIPINGKISFGGTYASDVSSFDWTAATQFNFIDTQWGQHTGDFASLFFGPFGTSTLLHISDADIVDFAGSGDGVTNFSFDLKSITFAITDDSFLAHGEAIAHITGFDSTFATWSIKGTPSFEFPLYTANAEFIATGVAVADGGVTGGLLLGSFATLIWFSPQKRRVPSQNP